MIDLPLGKNLIEILTGGSEAGEGESSGNTTDAHPTAPTQAPANTVAEQIKNKLVLRSLDYGQIEPVFY